MPFNTFNPNVGQQQPLSIPPSSSSSSSSNYYGGSGSMNTGRQAGFNRDHPGHYDNGGNVNGEGSSAGSGGMVSGLSAMMRRGHTGEMDISSSPSGANSSLSSNPHSGFHPSSYGPNLSFAALALGISNPNPIAGVGSYSNMGMSISPPHWGSLGSASYNGGAGMFGTSLNREREGRERELEASYVKDFSCCGRRLNGLHELLEHYEEEHANLPPDVRMAAMNAVQGQGQTPRPGPNPFSHIPPTPTSISHQHHQSDVPAPPGMMDIEMDEPTYPQTTSMAQQYIPNVGVGNVTSNPWAAAYRPQIPLNTQVQQPQCVPPSLLSYAPPTPTSSSSAGMTPEQLQARALRKAQKRAERAAREEASADDGDGERRFVCPIEGCGKVYKQANGLKYHLTRSINSGHGNVAALGGLAAILGDKGEHDE